VNRLFATTVASVLTCEAINENYVISDNDRILRVY
jgi:hypothetical protein